MPWLELILGELAISASDSRLWLAAGQALILACVCLLFGIWVSRKVGLLGSDASASESLGVGLAAGLTVLTAGWAALRSGGQSAFTPVAFGFAAAIGMAVVGWRREPVADPDIVRAPPVDGSNGRPHGTKRLVLVAVGGAVFIVLFGFLFSATMAQSPRNDVQPIEFMDEAFYSVLGDDLAKTGTETIYSTAGLGQLPGLPSQTWYHWGELWFASAAVTLIGTEPIIARFAIVLPILLLAAASLTGTLVRRVCGTSSLGAYAFGLGACLFLAPLPFVAGVFFGSWAVGMLFGITLYGLAAVVALLAIYCFVVGPAQGSGWTRAVFLGSLMALLVPANLVVAALGLVGLGGAYAARAIRAFVTTRHVPVVAMMWRRDVVATVIAIAATLAWGSSTGHGVGGSASSASVSAFNPSWRDALLINLLGAGAFLAVPAAWVMVRRHRPVEADLYVGTIAILIFGAVAWGARLGDFNMFHVYFAGIAVYAVPAAAIAVWSIQLRLRAAGHPLWAFTIILLCVAQITFGAGLSTLRLQRFGPGTYSPVPLAFLGVIRGLPVDAKLAYFCRPAEELAIWEPRLLGVGAHASRRIVPMCFQSEFLGLLNGTEMSPDVMSPFFASAPQRALYPDASASPSADSVATFLSAHGVQYIYADNAHPNTQVPGATLVAAVGEFLLFRLP